MRRNTNWLRVRLSRVERRALCVSKVLLLVHRSRCDCRAAVLAVGRVHGALRGKRGGHASTHGLVGHRTVGLRRVVGCVGVVVWLRLETTATTTVWLETLVLLAVRGLGRFAAHVGTTVCVGLSRKTGACLNIIY